MKIKNSKEVIVPGDIGLKFGDLLKSEEDILAHQTNCRGAMGAGIAKSIKAMSPGTYEKYVKHCDENAPEDLMGTMFLTRVNDDLVQSQYIANLFGQNHYGRGLQTDYQALRASLGMLRKFAEENDLSVGIPYGIGCGLAGGDWEVVANIIGEVFKGYRKVTLYKLP